MHEGRTMVEVLADVIADYQERYADLEQRYNHIVEEWLRLKRKVEEMGGADDEAE